MPAHRVITIPAGSYVSIPASIFARRMVITEDGAGTGSGLFAKFPDDKFTAIFSYPAAQQPLVIGDAVAVGDARGTILGWPAQQGFNARPADAIVELSSAGAATTVRVEEYE